MMQEFVEQAKKLMADMVNQIHTALPGSIVSFDPEKGLATVLPTGKFRKPDGAMMDFPPISGVPVLFPQACAQGASIVFPIKEGDGCLLIISEQALDFWMYGSESKAGLKYDLTNCIAIPGLFATANPLIKEACGQDAIIIDRNGNRIMLSNDNITIKGNINSEGSVNSKGNISGEGNVEIKGDMQVEGAVKISGVMTCGASVTVTGDISSSANMRASGEITAGGAISAGGNINAGGNVDAAGGISAGSNISTPADVVAGAISLKTHTHSGVEAGGDNTGGPK
jgi:cytoskeletal protein CcmA (bactofilin family)